MPSSVRRPRRRRPEARGHRMARAGWAAVRGAAPARQAALAGAVVRQPGTPARSPTAAPASGAPGWVARPMRVEPIPATQRRHRPEDALTRPALRRRGPTTIRSRSAPWFPTSSSSGRTASGPASGPSAASGRTCGSSGGSRRPTGARSARRRRGPADLSIGPPSPPRTTG